MALRYERIANDVRDQILSGTLAPGQRLPGEDAMAAEYEVSKNTIRQAMSFLQAEGLVEKRHGRGTFVRSIHVRTEYPITLPPAADGLPRDADVHTTVQVHHVQAGRDLSALLETPDDTWLIEYTYLARRVDNPPHSRVRAYVPRGLMENAPPGRDDSQSPWGFDLHHRLIAAGIALDHTTHRLTARHATPDEAEALTIPVGAPVLAIQRQTRDIRGHVVAAATLVLTGDRTEAVHSARLPGGLEHAGVPPVRLSCATP